MIYVSRSPWQRSCSLGCRISTLTLSARVPLASYSPSRHTAVSPWAVCRWRGMARQPRGGRGVAWWSGVWRGGAGRRRPPGVTHRIVNPAVCFAAPPRLAAVRPPSPEMRCVPPGPARSLAPIRAAISAGLMARAACGRPAGARGDYQAPARRLLGARWGRRLRATLFRAPPASQSPAGPPPATAGGAVLAPAR